MTEGSSVLSEIEKLSKEYRKCSREINTHDGLNSCTRFALDIFMKVAELVELPLRTVSLELEEAFESEKVLAFEGILEESFLTPHIPELGKFRASFTKGTVLFVDITGSTRYFQEKVGGNVIQYVDNYTGFVIFNAYILLVKSITRIFGGEFLEHTGDGVMLFFEREDFVSKYRNTTFFEEPIKLYFFAGEKLKKYAKQKNLIRYDAEHIGNSSYREPSLVHIGASFGEVLQVYFGNMKKLVSKTVWEAADRCKKASREVKYKVKYKDRVKYKVYYSLPIRCD